MEDTQYMSRPRLPIGKWIRRGLLIILAVIIIIFVLIYFLGRYKASETSNVNSLPDDFFSEKNLASFTKGKDILSKANSFDMNNRTEYVYPWTKDGVNKSTLTPYQIIDYARYQEEATKFNAEEKYEANLKKTKQEMEAFEATIWDPSRPVEEWIKEKMGYDYDEYKDIDMSAYSTLYDFLKDNYYDGTQEELYDIVKNDVGELDNYVDSDQAAAVIYKDTALFAYLCEFDADKYNELNNRLSTEQAIVDYFNAKFATLKTWFDYRNDDIFGFGTPESGFDGVPALTKKSSNGHTYEFWFNPLLTSFKIVEKDESDNVLQEWKSNVDELDPIANEANKTKERTIFTISYAVLQGETGSYGNYEYSIADRDSIGQELVPNYAYKLDTANNKLYTWYRLEQRGIDYTFFPKYINATRMDEYIARSKERAEAGVKVSSGRTKGETVKAIESDSTAVARLQQGYYKLIKANETINEFGKDYYEFQGNLENMSGVQKTYLYLYLYEWAGYTAEDLEADNSEFDQITENSKPYFEVGLEYSLTDNGLEVTVPTNCIKYNEDYPVTTIELLPYLGATKSGVEGYTIIPDGSGAILEHDNGKIGYSSYRKRVYTTDLSTVEYVNPGSFEELFFPMYGVVNPGVNSGLLVHAKEGGAQLLLTCDISGRTDNYNKNYFTAYLRESKVISVGSASYERKQLTKWTNKMCQDDIVIEYNFVPQDQLSYSGVAKMYRDLLIKQYGITSRDTTTNPVLNIDVIGTYSYKNNFIGIPYTAKDTLTTIDELKTIGKSLTDLGIQNINASYLGWRKENLVDTSFGSIKQSSLIGSKDKFKALLSANNSTLSVYPYLNFGQFTKFTESFGSLHYTSHSADGKRSEWKLYDVNSNVFDKTKKNIYSLSPRYYTAFAEKLAKNYSKATGNSSYLAVANLGSLIAGDYKRGTETFKVDAVKEQIKSFDILNNGGINKFTLYAPYDYAFKYANVVKDVPYQYTSYEILDYSIPFYQLVANGLFDYSGESINAKSEKGITEHVMRMIETGSNINFTLTYDSSEKLRQTDYNYYYFTLYTDWLSDIKDIYQQLNTLGIYGLDFVSHEKLANNIFQVTYKNDTKSVKVYLNYTRNDYTAPDGVVVPAKNYAVGL